MSIEKMLMIMILLVLALTIPYLILSIILYIYMGRTGLSSIKKMLTKLLYVLELKINAYFLLFIKIHLELLKDYWELLKEPHMWKQVLASIIFGFFLKLLVDWLKAK
jgi:hypothetical protein